MSISMKIILSPNRKLNWIHQKRSSLNLKTRWSPWQASEISWYSIWICVLAYIMNVIICWPFWSWWWKHCKVEYSSDVMITLWCIEIKMSKPTSKGQHLISSTIHQYMRIQTKKSLSWWYLSIKLIKPHHIKEFKSQMKC